MRQLRDGGYVFNGPKKIGRLDQNTGSFRGNALLEFLEIKAAAVSVRSDRHRHALLRSIGLKHLSILRMQALRHQHRTASRKPHGHHHRFRRGGRTVIHGSVGDLHASEFADHRLEFKNRLQCALGNLRLIGSVGGKELAARDQRIDDYWTIVVVRPRPQKGRTTIAVLARPLAKPVDNLRLRHLPRDFQVALKPVLGGDMRKQVVNRAHADCLQHRFAVTG